MIDVLERFLAKVKQTDSCWVWTGSRNTKGYGHLKFNGRMMLSHRLSYLLHKGEIPDGLLVCHTCNNKQCVNPDHLYLGTNQQNMLDAARDGLLANRNVASGSKHGHAKLTDEQVREIRTKYGEPVPIGNGKKIKSPNGVTMQEIANEYGISFAQANYVVRRKSYVDVQ